MLKKRYSKPGSSPATLVPHTVDGAVQKANLRVIEYDATHIGERQLAGVTELDALRKDGRVTWIDVGGLGDVDLLRELGQRFHIHPLALEDVLNTGQRPKVEVTADYVFVCLQMVYPGQDEVFGEQLSLFLGRHFVLTIQEEGTRDVFDPVRERIRSGRGMIRKSGADYLAYALLDSVIDHYFPVLEEMGEEVETLEDRLLETPSREMIGNLHDHRRDLTQVRRLVWPLRDVVSSLMHGASGFVSESTQVFLRDCYDHTVQLMDLVEGQRELTSSLMELYHSSVGLRTNEIMRVLTVITSVFIPLTFIVGVYGMNFASTDAAGRPLPLNMPELQQPYGYVTVVALMLLVAVIQLILFRKMKWL